MDLLVTVFQVNAPQPQNQIFYCWHSRLVLVEYHCWYTANIVNISVFDALSIDSGLVTAVKLCMKREVSEVEVFFSSSVFGINKEEEYYYEHKPCLPQIPCFG